MQCSIKLSRLTRPTTTTMAVASPLGGHLINNSQSCMAAHEDTVTEAGRRRSLSQKQVKGILKQQGVGSGLVLPGAKFLATSVADWVFWFMKEASAKRQVATGECINFKGTLLCINARRRRVGLLTMLKANASNNNNVCAVARCSVCDCRCHYRKLNAE